MTTLSTIEPDDRTWVFRTTDDVPRCHAATVVEAGEGDLLAAWYAGSREGEDDTATWMARFSGGEWSEPWILAKVPGHAHGNPRMFALPDGDVGIIYAVNYGAWCRGGSRNFIRRSADGGATWSCPREIQAGRPFLGKNKPLILDDPTELLLPVTLEGDPYGAGVLVGHPSGDHWLLTQELPGPEGVAILQPTLARLSDGSILMLLRTNAGHVWRARSTDRGRTWSEPEPTTVPNNHSGIDLAAVRGQDPFHPVPGTPTLFLALNPVSGPELRTPLVLMRSTDDGETWATVATLEDGEGEFSYPSMIVARDGAVHVVYTHRRTAIRHAAFQPGRFG